MGRTSPGSKCEAYRLLDAGKFDHALFCTYTFDHVFFEDYCLNRFDTLRGSKNICILLDQFFYEQLTQLPQPQRPRHANVRYLVHPIKVPGRFHSKLTLLASHDRGRLLIGSANLTRAGLTGNAEVIGCYDYHIGKQEQFVPLFQRAFGYFQALASRCPSQNLGTSIQEIEREAPWVVADNLQNSDIELLHNLDDPLLPQLLARLDEPVCKLSVVSRFFDQSPALLDELARRMGASRLNLFTQNVYTTLSPAWLDHPLVRNGTARLYLEKFSSRGRIQALHAKVLVLETRRHCIIAYGSANCTTTGLLRSANEGNAELLVCIKKPLQQAKRLAYTLLDPDHTAVALKKKSDLQSAPLDPPPNTWSDEFPIRLEEAELDGDRLVLWTRQRAREYSLRARIETGIKAYKVLPVKAAGPRKVSSTLAPELVKRLAHGTSLIRLEDSEGGILSNSVFLTNLIDLETGLSSRRERRIREAEQSASAFLSVLADLSNGTDEEALRTFLTYCDIRALVAPRLGGIYQPKPVWPGVDETQKVGSQGFELSKNLHELAIAFCERHFTRLQRHTKERDPDSIANFLHIALAIGAVLRLQIERAVEGLESREKVSTDEWSDFRGNCDVYFAWYHRLATLIWADYLAKMIGKHPAQKIRVEFEPDLQPLSDLGREMIRYRTRIEDLRLHKCLRTTDGKPYGYFYSILEGSRWPAYANDIQQAHMKIEEAVLRQVG